MGFFKRLFRKESRTDAYIYQDGITGPVYPKADYAKIAREGYQQNLICYRAIKMIADSCGSVDWNVFKTMGPDEAPEMVAEHPVSSILYRPNPQQGWAALVQDAISYYLLNGNSYIERVGLKTGAAAGTPKELYTLRPDRMRILKNDRAITGYKYGDGVRAVKWDVNPTTGQSDILHLKTFNPLDDFYGWAATMSAAGYIDNSNDALTWNRGMFKNGARPGTLVTMERSLTVEQYTKFQESLIGKYSGPKNAGKTLIIDDVGEGKVNITPWGWNPKELDFTQSSREDARRIAFAYGVPAVLLGIPGDSTYNNQKEARASLWEDTVIPMLAHLRDELNNWLFETGSQYYIDYDLSSIPALAEKREMLWKRAEDATFLTINEKREMQGLPPIDGGNVIFMQGGMVPVLGEDVIEAEETLDPEMETPEPDTPMDDEEVEEEEENARAKLIEAGIPEAEADFYLEAYWSSK